MSDKEAREARAVQRALALALRHLRKQKGIAQETLAIEVHMSRSHLSSIERGLGNPSIDTIARLLRYLGVDFAEFGAEMARQMHAKSR